MIPAGGIFPPSYAGWRCSAGRYISPNIPSLCPSLLGSASILSLACYSFDNFVVHSLGSPSPATLTTSATMSETDSKEKDATVYPHHDAASHTDEEVGIVNKGAALKTDLRGRHMQMIAVGTLVTMPFCFGPEELELTLKHRRCYWCWSFHRFRRCSPQRRSRLFGLLPTQCHLPWTRD